MAFRKRPRMSGGEAKKLQRIEHTPALTPTLVRTKTTRSVNTDWVTTEGQSIDKLLDQKRKPKPHKRINPKTIFNKTGK